MYRTNTRIDDEIAVWDVIHQHGLCRGQNVRVDHRNGELHLSGVIGTPTQRDELVARMKELRFTVVMQLQTVEEAAASIASPPSSVATSERVERVSAPGEVILHEWLRRQGVPSLHARASEIANHSVSTADLAWSEAWAIRDITTRFGPHWSTLPDSSRTRLLAILRDHSTELRALAARQRQLLSGVLPTVATHENDLYAAVEQWNLSIQQLFAPAETVPIEASGLLQRISSSLQLIETASNDDGALIAIIARPE